MDFEARSAYAFVQHLAVRLIANGYRFYVLGEIPSWKDPTNVDRKLSFRYNLGLSKWAQLRGSRRGEAKVRYLRFEHHFILIATVGRHRFFDEERSVLRDAVKVPIRCFGYELKACRRGEKFHPLVRLDTVRFKDLREVLLRLSLEDDAVITKRIAGENLLWFSGVKRQVFRILAEVNERRRAAGLEALFVARSLLINRSLKVF